MPFPWSSVGEAPAPEVPEICVFGPGYGECIVCHLGCGRWMIVDSCVDTDTGDAVSLKYLEALGVDVASAVELIVASHWHDDHVRGLAEVVKRCPNALFASADVLTHDEFRRFVYRHATGNLPASGSGTAEFSSIHRSMAARRWKRASPDRRLVVTPEANCEVWSLSPSDEEFQRFLDMLASTMPAERQVKRRAVAMGPNDASVVILVRWPDACALLGSDLETHGGATRGWGAIVGSNARPTDKASFVKVPHHGGLSAHHEAMWSEMLLASPVAVLTPFLRGGTRLPSRDDVQRILGLSDRAYISATVTARSSTVTLDRSVEKSLAEANIRIRKLPQVGLVRSRLLAGKWHVELFQEARQLNAA